MKAKFERGRNKYLFLISITLICNFIYFLTGKENEEKLEVPEVEIPKNFIFPLRNILMDEKSLNISAHRQIFLIETHLEKERNLTNPRQACTVESAGEKILTNQKKNI